MSHRTVMSRHGTLYMREIDGDNLTVGNEDGLSFYISKACDCPDITHTWSVAIKYLGRMNEVIEDNWMVGTDDNQPVRAVTAYHAAKTAHENTKLGLRPDQQVDLRQLGNRTRN